MFFDTSKGSLHAGSYFSGLQGEADTGFFTAKFGSNCTTSGDYSFASGVNNVVSGERSAGFGSLNNITSDHALLTGRYGQTNSDTLLAAAWGTGSPSVDGEGLIFEVKQGGRIVMANLPTTTIGLSAGDLWNNGGVINIV